VIGELDALHTMALDPVAFLVAKYLAFKASCGFHVSCRRNEKR
jgi:hypothetical protein